MDSNTLNWLESGFQNAFSPFFNKIALAVFILLVGFVLGRLLGLISKRFLSGISLDKHMKNAGITFSIERFTSWLVSVVIYAVTLVWSLNTLGLTSTIVTFVIIGIMFVLCISFLLAVKDFFPNLFSGLRIRVSGLFHVGDEIKIKEVKGRITSISLLETRLSTQHNEELIIPNALFTKRKILVKHIRK